MRRAIVIRLRSEWATLVVAVLLCAAVTGARFVTSDVGTAVGFLYAIPISLVAVRFGGRAGVAAGLIACGLLA
jgi:thiamine transporter ThiT